MTGAQFSSAMYCVNSALSYFPGFNSKCDLVAAYPEPYIVNVNIFVAHEPPRYVSEPSRGVIFDNCNVPGDDNLLSLSIIPSTLERSSLHLIFDHHFLCFHPFQNNFGFCVPSNLALRDTIQPKNKRPTSYQHHHSLTLDFCFPRNASIDSHKGQSLESYSSI